MKTDIKQHTPATIKRITSQDDQSRGTGLEIEWDDGENNFIHSDFLRRQCPCADCEEKRTAIRLKKPSLLNIVKANEAEETNITKIWPIGNYALGILWGDNHSTGIYTFQYLKQLCQAHRLKDRD